MSFWEFWKKRGMVPRASEKAFKKHIRALGYDLKGMSPAAGLEAMLSFYRNTRAEGCDHNGQGDMLLFQGGTYDWGNGKNLNSTSFGSSSLERGKMRIFGSCP